MSANLYTILSRALCKPEVLYYAKQFNSSFKFTVRRIAVENTFNDVSKEKSPTSVIKWNSIARPIFFYTGLKTVKYRLKDLDECAAYDLSQELDDKKLFRLLLYTLLYPSRVMQKILSIDPYAFVKLKTSDVFVVTLTVANYILRKYMPEITVTYVHPIVFTKGLASEFQKYANEEVGIDYSTLKQTSTNSFIIEYTNKGLQFFQSIFAKYSPDAFGELFRHIILCDQLLTKYNVINFNINTSMRLKNALSNYQIPEDKMFIQCIDRMLSKYITKNWMSLFKITSKQWLGRTLTAIIDTTEYITYKRDSDIINLPVINEPVKNIIDMKALNTALELERKRVPLNIPADKYQYLSLNMSKLNTNIDYQLIITKLRELFKLDTLEMTVGSYFNRLFILYKLPANYSSLIKVEEYDIYHLQESNEPLTIKILLNMAFEYIIGANVQTTPLYRFTSDDDKVYVEGCLCNFKEAISPIVSKNNKMLYKDILSKYGQKLSKIFNEWIEILLKSSHDDIPTALLTVVHERILKLFNSSTWI